MLKLSQSLAIRFIGIALVVILVLVVPFSAYLISQSRETREESTNAFLEQKEKELRSKGEMLSGFVARISPEAVMAQDLYLLKAFGGEVMRDSTIVSLTITKTDGSQLLHLESGDFKDIPDTLLIGFEATVKTDKERLGIEQELGKIRLQLDRTAIEIIRKESLEAMTSGIRRITVGLLTFSLLICIALSAALFFAMRLLIFRPLAQVSDRIAAIGEGEGDLTHRLGFDAENEVGTLAKGFDHFLDTLQGMVKRLLDNATSMDSSLAGAANGSRNVVEASRNLTMRSQAVSSDAASVTTEVGKVTSSMSELDTSIQGISTALIQMNSALAEASRNSTVESQKSQETDRLTADAAQLIEGLTDSARSIRGILETINAIAGQTRLLALNATIEAAAAGEAGKGFAVVANEVKELARRTADATQGIRSKVEAIETQVSHAVDAIGMVRGKVGEMKDASLQVSASVEEQSITLGSITQQLGEVTRLAGGVNSALQRSTSLLQNVKENIVVLDQVVGSAETEVRKSESSIRAATEASRDLRSTVGKFRV